jgi:N-acyl-D-aspartate/D-glutamate deacylase
MSHSSGKNTFSQSEHYKQAMKESRGDLGTLMGLLRQPSTRQAILHDMTKFKEHKFQMIFQTYKDDKGAIIPGWMLDGDLVYPWTASYEPTEDQMVSTVAEATGKTPLEVQYDMLLDTNAPHAGVLWRPLFMYNGDNDDIVDCMYLDNVIPGFDDAGAHCTILTDATCATSNIAYFGRDRVAGDGRRVPLEKLVKIQTSDAAAMFGLNDRGTLKVGMRADLNIIDMEKVNIKAPYWANDLPTNAGRWLQDTQGYNTTVLRGVVTFQNDQHTGVLPGRLVRNPLMIGAANAVSGVPPARVDAVGKDIDLSSYATEISRGGGASAVARVLREETAGNDDEIKSKL